MYKSFRRANRRGTLRAGVGADNPCLSQTSENMKKRKRPSLEDSKGIAKLTAFETVLRKALTIPPSTLIKRINDGYTQSQIAREFGTSRSAVSQRAKSLKAKGLLSLTHSTGSGKQSGYDVHLGSISYPLAKPVKLPFVVKGNSLSLTWQEWNVKGHRIRQNLGKDGTYSLEIFGTRVEGFDTIQEAENTWVDDCRNLYGWLCEHYPELREASREQNFKINRSGKLTIHALKGTAEQALRARGGGSIMLDNVGMIDDSLKNGGEFHVFLSFFKNLATKEEVKKLDTRLEGIEKGVMLLGERQMESNKLLERLATSMEKLLGLITPKEKPEPPPPELQKDEQMFR